MPAASGVRPEAPGQTVIAAALDGGLAVLCNPKPASRGVDQHVEYWVPWDVRAAARALKVGSCDGTNYKPRQDRKVATVSRPGASHKETWPELALIPAPLTSRDRAARPFLTPSLKPQASSSLLTAYCSLLPAPCHA